MRLALLCDADAARGFRLAGVDATVCRTREDVERAASALASGEPAASVVLVSDTVYRLAPAAIDDLRDHPRWPIVVVLPEPGVEERSAV